MTFFPSMNTFTLGNCPGPLPEQLCRLALDHDLWDAAKGDPQHSLFHNLWVGASSGWDGLEEERQGFLVALAWAGRNPGQTGTPVAVGLLERAFMPLAAERFREKRGQGPVPVPGSRQPWSIPLIGAIGFYVIPACRGRSIAARLLTLLERARLAELVEARSLAPADVSALAAGGRAHALVGRAASACRPLISVRDCLRRREEINLITAETIAIRRGDPAPLIRPLADWGGMADVRRIGESTGTEESLVSVP